MTPIKAIETHYDGNFYRSRLEARWAVFFNFLKIKFHYEPEGFDLGDEIRYLPDFWLPQVRMWAEVKWRPLNKPETEKAQRLAQLTEYPILILIGPPENKSYAAWERFYTNPDQPPGMTTFDYCLTMEHGYPVAEGRFYCGDETFDDVERAATAARQARFEHGQVGAPSEWESSQ